MAEHLGGHLEWNTGTGCQLALRLTLSFKLSNELPKFRETEIEEIGDYAYIK